MNPEEFCTNLMNAEEFYTNLSKYIRWNPDEKYIHNGKVYTDRSHTTEAVIYRDYEGLIEWLKRHFPEPSYYNEVGDSVKVTAMPLGNLILELCPDVDTKRTFKNVIEKGPYNNGRWGHVLDTGEVYVETLQNVMKTASLYYNKVGAKAADSDLDKLISGLSSLSPAKQTVLENILGVKVEDIDLSEVASAKDTIDKLRTELEDKDNLLSSTKDKLSRALSSASVATAPVKVKKDGPIPDGEMKTRLASEIFDAKLDRDLEVPYWEWDGEHPDVPDVDENYIFRPHLLQRVLYCLVTGDRGYLQGHTGSGKTTLIEQVAARLNYPFARINFDSEVTRMDLIGRDQLSVDVESGTTKSHFVDGILPRVMSGPYITCFDEIDFCRPDVAYVMQAALENNALRITEDGDRIVTPHSAFRMFATGNTVGQGDEHGMYQGARAQSLALLDRFTVWMRVPYLDETQRSDLLERKFPLLEDKDRDTILKYVTEHLTAFEDGRVLQPLSPRGILAIANATQILGSVKEALTMVVLDKASEDDRSTLFGIVDRVV